MIQRVREYPPFRVKVGRSFNKPQLILVGLQTLCESASAGLMAERHKVSRTLVHAALLLCGSKRHALIIS